eukprot:m.80283 g.80283  ORF g.80283 m.80283 type:complete len:504 (+) comp25298_c0_seq2:209-1720(+)
MALVCGRFSFAILPRVRNKCVKRLHSQHLKSTSCFGSERLRNHQCQRPLVSTGRFQRSHALPSTTELETSLYVSHENLKRRSHVAPKPNANGDCVSVMVNSELARCVIRWPDGHHSSFLNAWLRDHCRCSSCLNPSTHQRSFDSLKLPMSVLDVQCTHVALDAEHLRLTIQLGPDHANTHICTFPLDWLKAHCPDARDESLAHQQHHHRHLWDNSVISTRHAEELLNFPFTLAYSDVTPNNPELIRDHLRRYGIAFVTGVPVLDDFSGWTSVTEDLVRKYVGFPRETIWGIHWDTAGEVSSIETDKPPDTAYTSEPLNPHVDCCYLRDPPQLQVFLSVTRAPTVDGGRSTFLDGFKAAELLFTRSKEAFQFFCNTPLPYHCEHDGVSVTAMAPVFELDRRSPISPELIKTLDTCPPIARFRYNNDDRSPLLHLSSHQIDLFYTHLPLLLEVLRDPQLMIEVQLDVGDMVIVDNHRVLHGRTAFSGAGRNLFGCYAEMDEVCRQ